MESAELNLNAQDLKNFDSSSSLYDLLVKYPQEVIPIMDFVVYDVLKSKYPDASQALKRIQV